ncbi:MAG: OmpH family outer membrane protein [Acidobacteriota bacterium]|mgnify:CR=1 FL=1|jgi:Skp family chaperone for outer membrane proteins|nr:OmpH family outer membrane protein [Acidobacteriota bacterium]HNQ80502.1 OmpH family outer membrane protein [Candidatus Aminicenantes bacterium]MDD8028652.1 OmpH family outer membrane protein [Acidobacteriota bacterium]MDD8033178.1 OmpH family outer membrane protein [Acidobacteriota bacterium]MDD8038911.1 OmpH family outer membrane protein [Acidobacteriota bacterium]
MRKSVIAAALAVLCLGAAANLSFAQGKIGVLDSQQVLERSAEGKKVIARLQESEKKNTAAVTALDDQIRQIQTKLNTGRLTMTDEAALQLQADLERKTTERKRVAEDAVAGMQELSNRLFMKLQSELMPIVQAVGKEKGLDIIFDVQKSGAVYWAPAVDVTEDIIKRYDASKASEK